MRCSTRSTRPDRIPTIDFAIVYIHKSRQASTLPPPRTSHGSPSNSSPAERIQVPETVVGFQNFVFVRRKSTEANDFQQPPSWSFTCTIGSQLGCYFTFDAYRDTSTWA